MLRKNRLTSMLLVYVLSSHEGRGKHIQACLPKAQTKLFREPIGLKTETAKTPPSVILLFLDAPLANQTDGISLIQELRRLFPATPIVALTGDSKRQLLARLAGAHVVPLPFEDLQSIVTERASR